jgi:signal transduction histidine kinase
MAENRKKLGLFRSFRAADAASFGALVRHLGFRGAACYRLASESMTQVLAAVCETDVTWPAAVTGRIEEYYTSDDGENVPLGFVRSRALTARESPWPKSTVLYFPEQDAFDDRFVIALALPPDRRARLGGLSGELEAIVARVRHWQREQDGRVALAETTFKERSSALGVDFATLVDHELRTPLASVAGYAALLGETDPVYQREAFVDYLRVIEGEAAKALEALDKLSIALAGATAPGGAAAESFDAAVELGELCRLAKDKAAELVGRDAASTVTVRLVKATDHDCRLHASLPLFREAVLEVLKNAVTHARGGKVEAQIYRSSGALVIDVADDGPGPSAGAEELIFLRFYQEPSARTGRRGKRGLGLGLFLARSIVERHLGQLTFVRARGGGVFRFVWPVGEAATADGATGEGESEELRRGA